MSGWINGRCVIKPHTFVSNVNILKRSKGLIKDYVDINKMWDNDSPFLEDMYMSNKKAKTEVTAGAAQPKLPTHLTLLYLM